MDLTTPLRETILSHADGAPTGAGLLDGVRRRHKRLRRKRFALGAAALVIAAGGGFFAAPLALGTGPHTPGVQGSALVPYTAAAPAFPYAPAWVPDGSGTALVLLQAGRLRLSYPDRGAGLEASIGKEAFPGASPAGADSEQDRTVGGKPAKLRTGQAPDGPRTYRLAWPHGEGEWVTVDYTTGDEADVLRFAEGLRPGRLEVPSPFRLSLAPGGFTMTTLSWQEVDDVTGKGDDVQANPGGYEGRMQLTPEGSPDPRTGISILALPASGMDLSGRPKTTIGGREAWLWSDFDLRIRFGDRIIRVAQDAPWLSKDDLIRFAAGIDFAPPGR